MRTPGHVKRAPRIDANIGADVTDSEGHRLPVTIVDISKDGCRMETDGTLIIGEFVEIHLDDGTVHRAQIRWALGDEAGASFLDPARLPEEGY
ncbi:PilZ domain-containing protein [Sphingomonas jaspsi]|jgi:hypothetical protein|uniref:PilZ domain-containing protein n=1 Tax=Sphingomonas jaspsi TaxID=392409 RepID=UPI00055D038C|nr:PilZ domain-containing protein [Sphingomonas jaspsi]